jgi:hypothetical protein
MLPIRSLSSLIFSLVLLPLVLLPIVVGCSRSAESLDKLQSQILEDIGKQGGNSLKSVVCSPKNGDKPLQCLGILESGSGFDIEIKQQEDQAYEWNVPSIKGLLNMLQVQTAIQDELRQDVGETTLNCGGEQKYKAVKAGDSFDCQLTITKPVSIAQKPPAQEAKAETKAPTAAKDTAGNQAQTKSSLPPTKIAVTILPSGDVNWQKVLPEEKKATKSASDPTTKAGQESANKATQETTTKASDNPADSTKPSPNQAASNQEANSAAKPESAAKSADDFLNQAGATDDFD